MLPWRVLAVSSVGMVFVLSGWQVQRLVDGRTRSDALMWSSIVAGLVATLAVLMWTYSATENASRLVAPAKTVAPPDPWQAVASWALPVTFVAVAVAVVAYLSRTLNTADEDPSSAPLAIAVLSVLLAVPVAARPFHFMSRVVRQIGGQSAHLARWLWVPVTLGLVGVATIVGLHLGGAVDTTDELAPMWVVGVIAIAPCVIVVLLAWRAAGAVEESVKVAAARRIGRSTSTVQVSAATGRRTPARPVASAPGIRPAFEVRDEVAQLPGSDSVRIAIEVATAGLALLSVVGAVVMLMFWLETRDGVILASQRDKAWDTLDALYSVARVVAVVAVTLASIWSFIAVLNARLASGLRRNPVIAALAWPVVCVGIWMLGDRFTVDAALGRVIVGLTFQAAAMYVPFAILERAAQAVQARRTPIRVVYMFAVVLLVYTQGLIALTDTDRTVSTYQYGRLAFYLALGALVLLLLTVTVTVACRAVADASKHEAGHHNALVEQRRGIEKRATSQATSQPTSQATLTVG